MCFPNTSKDGVSGEPVQNSSLQNTSQNAVRHCQILYKTETFNTLECTFKRCFLNRTVRKVGKRVKLESQKQIHFPVTKELKGVQREFTEVQISMKMFKHTSVILFVQILPYLQSQCNSSPWAYNTARYNMKDSVQMDILKYKCYAWKAGRLFSLPKDLMNHLLLLALWKKKHKSSLISCCAFLSWNQALAKYVIFCRAALVVDRFLKPFFPNPKKELFHPNIRLQPLYITSLVLQF